MPKCASTSLNDYFKFLCQQPMQGHKTFLFLREPYGRLKSAFRMKCLNELAPNNFSSTIKKYHEFLKGKPIPYAHYNDMIHFIPQLSFIDSVDIEFDYMGRVENLQHSIDQLNTALNIKKYKVKHMNKNTLDKKHNKQFEKEYQKHMKENKTFYTNFLEKDMRLYDIQN